MLLQMILKEWKEKFGLFLFALAGYGVFSVAFVISSQDQEALDLLLGTMVLVFVPIISLLLGASAFFTEFRNDAWAYLFSRPAPKWRIWLAKYVSLLSLLAIVLVVCRAIIGLHPALKAAAQTFNVPLRFGVDIPFVAFAQLLPLSLFTVAFSLSILSEKAHVTAFLAALISYPLFAALTYGPEFLALMGFRYWMFSGFVPAVAVPLVSLSFAAASILTLGRADFSQPGRRAWLFTKFAAVFLAASLGLGLAWAYTSGTLHRSPRLSSLNFWNGGVYFTTDTGLYRSDPGRGKTERLVHSPFIWSAAVGGNGVVAYTRHVVRGREASQEISVIDGEGKKPRPLLKSSDPGSPIQELMVYPVRVSSRGDRIAFITGDWRNARVTWKIWSMKPDGASLKSFALDFPEVWYCSLLGFDHQDRSVFILDRSTGAKYRGQGWRLARVDLDDGAIDILVEGVHRVQMPAGQNPGQTSSLIAYTEEAAESLANTLAVLDPRTREKKIIYQGGPVDGFRWNAAGDKLGFLIGKTKLCVYSVSANKVLALREVPRFDLRWPIRLFDWVSGDRLVLRRFDGAVESLLLFDAGLTQEQKIDLPFSYVSPVEILGAGSCVLAADLRKHELWSLDLSTNRWQRIY
jgi:ABC-type transport system involved in multi-copper enzyme maturation permease subunit